MNTRNMPYQYKKLTRNYPKFNKVCRYEIFCLGLKNEFEIAMVNEPSVFEPLKFYSIALWDRRSRARQAETGQLYQSSSELVPFSNQ